MDKEDAVSHKLVTQNEDDTSEEDNSDNDSVDSAQLLADITDVLNSSDPDFLGEKTSDGNITVSYLDKDCSAPKPSDKTSVKQKPIQDVDILKKYEKAVSASFIASSNNDHKSSINSEINCTSEKHQDASTVRLDTVSQIWKEPVVLLTRLDPNQILQYQSLSLRVEMSSGDKKARRKGEIKKSAWYDEDSPLSDISVSDVSDPEDEKKVSTSVPTNSDSNPKLNEQKPKEMKDRVSKAHEKNPKSNSSRHGSEQKKGVAAPFSSVKTKVVHSNQISSHSQSKKSTTSGVKISNPIDKSKVNAISSKSTEKDRKVTEKSKTTILTDSKKRRLSKDEAGIDSSSSQSSSKHQKVTSTAAKIGSDLKYQGASLLQEKNQKHSSVETKRSTNVTRFSDWRYELHLSPVDIDDLSNESFRKFINLASDCAINFDSSHKSCPAEGHVSLYFGTAPQMQSGMQKLCQVSLIPPKILQGVIKCRLIKQVAKAEKWTSTEEVKLGFSMFSTWTEKVKQLVQVKDWKREDETKRKFAQIQRIPPIVSKEMISLLFPFSHNVHITRPNAGGQKKDSSGHTSVEFENMTWLETVLSCFRDLYVAKSGNGNPAWNLKITNFTPRPEKIPERSVTATRNMHGPKTPADSTSKDKLKDSTRPKHSDRYQAKGSRETTSVSKKDELRKRPLPVSHDSASAGGGSAKKRRPSEGISSVSAFDQSDGRNLKTLAQSKGLDPNNIDVLRILEVQNQLMSLQSLFSCTSVEDTTNLHVDESHSQRYQGHDKLNRGRDSNSIANPNSSIAEAEKQLRDNIANKQKQLRELEKKLQQKRSIQTTTSHDNLQNQWDVSRTSIAASRNNEPLDFTKPAPKIEEAVKKDEERSKMFASGQSVSSFIPHHSKGKERIQEESSITAEDFALPLQFGKNVSKVAINEIAHQNDKKALERKNQRQSTNRSGQRKSRNERPPLLEGLRKGSASNVAWNQQKDRRNFGSGKPVEWTRQSQPKEENMLDCDRFFIFEDRGSSKSDGNLFQANLRPDHNRMHQNFGSSHSKSSYPKTNNSPGETVNERYPGDGYRSQMAHEKMWQENFHIETRQFPENEIKSGSEVRRAQSGRNELVKPNARNEYWEEFKDEGDRSFDGNRQDNVYFFRENDQPEKLRKTSDEGAGRRNQLAAPTNQLAAPTESPRGLYDQQRQQEMIKERYFGNAWKGEDRFEDSEELDYSEHGHGAFEYAKGNTDFSERNEVFDHEFGFQEESLRGRESSLRARDIGVRGRGDIKTRGRGLELLRSTAAGGRGIGFQRGGAVGGRGTEHLRGAGIRGRGHELQRGTVVAERDSELQRGGTAGGRGTKRPRGFGMRGRGSECQRGGDADSSRGLGMMGISPRPTEERDHYMDSSVGLTMGGRGLLPQRGRGTIPQRGMELRGIGSECERGGDLDSSRGLGMMGISPRPHTGRPTEERDRNMDSPVGLTMGGRGLLPQRGRGPIPQRGMGLRGRGIDPQRGLEMRKVDAEPQFAQNESDHGPLFGNRMREQGIERQGSRPTEMIETSLKTQRGRGIGGRGRGILQAPGIVGRDAEFHRNTETEESSFGGGRGVATRGRGMHAQRITGMRGRGRETHHGSDGNERNLEMGGSGTEMSQRGFGMRGRDGHNLRGNGINGRGRGLDLQRGSMAERDRVFQSISNFPDASEEQSSFGGFGVSEESFHGVGSRGASLAQTPVIRNNTSGRGQVLERQREQMSQRGRGRTEMHSTYGYEDFANEMPSPATDGQRTGNSRGRGQQNLPRGFGHRQSEKQEPNPPMSRGGSVGNAQREIERGMGFGIPPRGRGGIPGGRGFRGPPASSSGDNLGRIQFQQRGQESGGFLGGRGNFNIGQSDRPRGRGLPPPINFGRGGNMMARGNM